jgi:hypothetical protein
MFLARWVNHRMISAANGFDAFAWAIILIAISIFMIEAMKSQRHISSICCVITLPVSEFDCGLCLRWYLWWCSPLQFWGWFPILQFWPYKMLILPSARELSPHFPGLASRTLFTSLLVFFWFLHLLSTTLHFLHPFHAALTPFHSNHLTFLLFWQ